MQGAVGYDPSGGTIWHGMDCIDVFAHDQFDCQSTVTRIQIAMKFQAILEMDLGGSSTHPVE